METSQYHSNDHTDLIIVAEDSPTQSEQLKYILEKHQYNVLVGRNGKIALELIKQHNPMLIISDIVMPEMNGYELCREVKSDEATLEIPVILLTSLSNSEDVLEGISCGADNFITKPYNEEYLITHIEQVLTNKRASKNERVRIGVEVLFGGKKRFITADQQQMLSLLISTYEAAIQRNNELVHAQEELKALNEHLEDLVMERTSELVDEIETRKKTEVELIKAKEKAEESDKLKSAFLTNISHEIRTPMNSICGFANLLNDPELTKDKMQEYCGLIYKSSLQLLNIINEIVDISKIEAGQIDIRQNEVNINELISENIEINRSMAGEKNLELKFYKGLDDAHSVIFADKTKVQQILNNLVVNAIKYTPEGFVEVGYYVNEEELEFFVKDTGIGIRPECRDKVFDRFYQADRDDGMLNDGAGLGLSITKAFVERMGGRIWCDSGKGKGSVFSFTLPYKPVAGAHKNPGEKKKNKVLDWKDKTVLIAEDVEESYIYISELLSGTGINVIHARNGLEAVKYCQEKDDINLVLMDVRMPVMDGSEATKRIKAFSPELPVIVQTAFAMSNDEEKAKEWGADDYITKPINGPEVIQKILQYICT